MTRRYVAVRGEALELDAIVTEHLALNIHV
jgi:hypothetical protein